MLIINKTEAKIKPGLSLEPIMHKRLYAPTEVLAMKLFDLDGTLIDSNGIWQDVDRKFLSAYHLPITEEYLDVVSHSIFPVAAQFTKEYYHLNISPEEIMRHWQALAKDAYEHQIDMKPGAKEYLLQEYQKGETLVLVSACAPELGHAVLNRHGLTPLFQHIIFAQEVGLEKRSDQFFPQILSRLGVSADNCVFFDDAPDNCASAKKVGMTVIGVLDRFYSHGRSKMQEICDQCIPDFTKLLD